MSARTRLQYDTSNPLKFQAIEFVCEDQEVDNGADERDFDAKLRKRIAIVHAFGVTEQGNSVCASVTGFYPFFFIELPGRTDMVAFRYIVNSIGNSISSYHRANIELEKCEIVLRKSFYGFQNGRQGTFGCIKFRTFATCKAVFGHLSKQGKYKTFEGKIDQLFKFIHNREIESWVEIPANKYVHSKNATTQISVEVYRDFFRPCDESEKIAPIRQCTVDIETFSSRSTERELEQCDPTLQRDVCFQIASAFKTFGSGVGEFDMKHIIVVGPCDTWDDEKDGQAQGRTVVERYSSEAEALLAWARLIAEMDPDIIYTWNGDYFDFDYMVKRAKLLKIDLSFLTMISRLRHKPAEMEETSFTSKAFGTSDFRRLHMFGRINADLLPYMRKETKHRLYKLGYIADQYGIGDKNPVTVHMIFASFREQDSAKIAEVARYCIQDTLLPQLLVDKLKILPNLVELSRATYAPIRYLLHRGQQIRIICLLSKHTRQALMLIPDIKVRDEIDEDLSLAREDEGDAVSFDEEEDESEDVGPQCPIVQDKGARADLDKLEVVETDDQLDTLERAQLAHKRKSASSSQPPPHPLKKPKSKVKGYQGATVLPPDVGAYYQPITTLDFASLYPSIMRAENLCYSTFVLDEGLLESIPKNKDHIFTVNDENGKFSYKFVTSMIQEGILPKLLANLAQLRKNAKRDLAKEMSKEVPDEFVCSILDARQLSKKLIMNSCYGFLATPTLPCKQISETVTAVGRNMIERTKKYIYDNWPGHLDRPDHPDYPDPRKRGARVIYGDTDSVFVDFNLDPQKYPTMKEHFEFAEKTAAEITHACFKPPHNLEFEKIYQPLFMLMKKRYFGLKYTRFDKPPTVDNRGVVIQRRDVCEFVQETFTECRDLVLHDTVNGGTRAVDFLNRALDDLIEERVAIEKFSITKTYSKDYANPMGIPHAAVAMKMRKNGIEVCKGDKIQYVYARCEHSKSGIGEKRTKSETAQEVSFVTESKNRYKVDEIQYIDLLQQPIRQFLDLVVGESVMTNLFKEKRYKLGRRLNNLQDIETFLAKNVPEDPKKPTATAKMTNSKKKVPTTGKSPHTVQTKLPFTASQRPAIKPRIDQQPRRIETNLDSTI